MNLRRTCAVSWILVFAAGSTAAPAQSRPRTLRVVNVRAVEASIKNASVTPQPLQFLASDPDLGSVPANSQATLNWEIVGAHATGTWTVSVAAGASAFSGCGTVPVSAITVRCASSSGGTCGAPFQLSPQPQTVASGGQGNGNTGMTVIVNFTFQDAWQYIAGLDLPCTLNLNYEITGS